MASIRDVARVSGVSTATVSHVLHGRHDRVSEETRQRVLAAIRQLRYRPPLFSADEDNIKTRSIGVLAGDLTRLPISTHLYFSQALDGIIEVAFLRGWTVHLFVERMWDEIGTSVRRGYDGRCDGLISIAPTLDNPTIVSLQERGVPLVLLGTSAFLPDVSSVDIDNEAAGNTLGRHLINLGHSRFAYVGSDPQIAAALEREAGLKRAMLDAGLDPATNLTSFFGRDRLDHVPALMQLPKDRRPTAFFGWNDGDAHDLLRIFTEMGINVPGEVSVVGVDDDRRSMFSCPPLTTITNPVVALGRRAAHLLIDKVTDPNQPSETVKFSPDLIVRGSTGPAPGAEVPKSSGRRTSGSPHK